MTMDRRDFVKSAAMAAAVAAAQGGAARAAAPAMAALDDVTWDKAPCRFCGTGCHVRVGAPGTARVVSIAGDANGGRQQGPALCKGLPRGP